MPSKYSRAPVADDDSDSSTKKMPSQSTSEACSIQEGLTETTPLLVGPLKGDDSTQSTPKRSPQAIVLLMASVLLIMTCGDQLMNSPQTRIFESIICYRYYEEADPSKIAIGREAVGPGAIGGVAEHFCKVDTVQSELALLGGYQQLLEGIPALLLALPIGWIADRFGRKPVLCMGIISFLYRDICMKTVCWLWQSFDIRWTWFSSTYGLLSGGNTVISALFFVVISDVTPEATRTKIFLRLGAASFVSALGMPPLSAWLMVYNPWIPYFIGTALTILGSCLVFLVPETLNYTHHSRHPSPESLPEVTPAPPELTEANLPISFDYANRWITDFRSATSFLSEDWRVPALILTFIQHILVGNIGPLALQYLSKQYNLTFSQATIVFTIRAAVNMILLCFLLPWVADFATKRFHLSSQRKDLYLSRLSAMFMVIGFALFAISPNVTAVAISLAITSLGAGTMLLIRSFLTSLVEPNQVARVYSIISMVDTVGSMFGAPLLAALFRQGLEIGGAGVGLPFLFLSLVSLVLVILLFVIRIRRGEDEEVVSSEGEA